MFSPDSARRIHKRILRKVGIDESIRFHDLRHTFTTMALSGGADPKTISGMLGHTSVEFTMNVYGHFTPQMQRDAAEKVAQVMER